MTGATGSPKRLRRDRGAALILALGVLALLTFVALAFATLTRVEVRASQNYRDGERARYAAWSGIERGKFEVRRAVQTPNYPLPWLFPNLWDYEKKTPNTVSPGSSNEVFDVVDDGNHVLVATRQPSLGVYLEDKDGKAPRALQPVKDGTSTYPNPLPWPSGFVGATYYDERTTVMAAGSQVFLGDYYTLRITDASTQINVNDQAPNLSGMLDTLGAQVKDRQNLPIAGLGGKVIAARDGAAGFLRRLEELKGKLTQDEFDAVSPYLTTVAYVDKKVIETGSPTTGSGLNKLIPQPRAPINVNLAPKAVLVAVLSGKSGSNGLTQSALTYRDAAGASHTCGFSPGDLADAIIAYRENPSIPVGHGASSGSGTSGTTGGNPYVIGFDGTNPSRRYGFTGWPEFKQFLMGLKGSLANWNANDMACVLANANPNSDINKLVPDASIYHSVDKSDLVLGTTEFCFSTTGVFTIEAIGVILGPDGKCVAQARARSVVRAFERYVETTQVDFEADRIDPQSPDGGFKGLRDVTSLPEIRNASDAVIDPTLAISLQEQANGLHAAVYDGQLEFNVITKTTIAADAAYAGFIDRTFDAQRVEPAVPGKTKRPKKGTLNLASGTPMQKQVDVLDTDPLRWDGHGGTTVPDLHALGAYLGRPRIGGSSNGRYLTYPQSDQTDSTPGVISSQHHEIPETTISMNVYQEFWNTTANTLSGTVDINLVSSVPDFGYDAIENEGFELWFKPSIEDQRDHQMLFDWHSGPVQTQELSALDMLRGTAAADSDSFDTEFFAGMLKKEADRKQNVKEPINYGVETHFAAWIDRDGSNGTYTFHAELLMNKPGAQGESDPKNIPFRMHWDHPQIADPSKNVRPGTWHHFLVTFSQPSKPPSAGGSAGSGQVHGGAKGKVTLYVDGNEVTVKQPLWPDELSAEGQGIKAVIKDFEDRVQDLINAEMSQASSVGATGGITQGSTTFNYKAFNAADYRVPCIIPPHSTVNDPSRQAQVWVGCKADQNPPYTVTIAGVAGSVDHFLGLIDNVVIDNNYIREIVPGGPETDSGFLRRYDTWRPSTAKDNTTTTTNVFYRKHTPALEWSRPIRIVSYDVTAWMAQPENPLDQDTLVELGRVYVHFGWANRPGRVPAKAGVPGEQTPLGYIDPKTSLPYAWLNVTAKNYDATLQASGKPADLDGWTSQLSERPFSPLANGYLLPDRESAKAGTVGAMGFLTLTQDEEYNYALEIKPMTDKQNGPGMAPVIDDVTVVYMPWDVATVVLEEEVID